mgnify:CR=1 FL=1
MAFVVVEPVEAVVNGAGPRLPQLHRWGAIVVPAALRQRYGLEEGELVIVEEREDWILLRPADAVPVEVDSPERRAEFLLTNAVDAEDDRRAVEEGRAMGLDPDQAPHRRPTS